jgi:hypothetical protein
MVATGSINTLRPQSSRQRIQRIRILATEKTTETRPSTGVPRTIVNRISCTGRATPLYRPTQCVFPWTRSLSVSGLLGRPLQRSASLDSTPCWQVVPFKGTPIPWRLCALGGENTNTHVELCSPPHGKPNGHDQTAAE